MRALARIATPVAVLVSGCAFPVDDFRAPARSDVGLSTNGDAAHYEDADERDSAAVAGDAGVGDDAANDSGGDTCVCLKQTGGKCREWSSPGCGK